MSLNAPVARQRSGARPARVLLSGYYGFRNAGDEAVLAGLVRAFRDTPGGDPARAEITALSIDPDATRAEQGVAAAHRYKSGALLRAVAQCDLLASGGGSLLQDVTSPHSIYYYLGVVRLAQLLGKKTVFIAQGIGPLTLPRSRRMTAAVARRCDALMVRDEASAWLLRSLGVEHPPITVTADPALLLGHPPDQSLLPVGAAVSLRAWHAAPRQFPEQVARCCHEALGAPVVSSMLMSPDDAAVHARFFHAFQAAFGLAAISVVPSDAPGWRSSSRLAAQTSLVIGMRLHALILAAANGVPSVALAYDPKVRAFMEQTGQADAVFDVSRVIDYEALTALLRRVWATRALRAERLRARLPALQNAARRNAELALAVLGR